MPGPTATSPASWAICGSRNDSGRRTLLPPPRSPRGGRWEWRCCARRSAARTNGGRTADERQTIEQVKVLEPQIQQAVQLLERFAHLLREGPYPHPEQRFDHWIAAAAGAGLPEFDAFVAKLQQDRAAVLAGLRLPWNQGQTEGQVTKRKLLKRQMYGRASFPLLKQRMLHAHAAA
jgi:transposase